MSLTVAEWLAAELSNGGRDSRELHFVASERGFTRHQVRYARECLGLTVSRRGNRRSMRSIWSLPDALPPADPIADAGVPVNGEPRRTEIYARAREGLVRTGAAVLTEAAQSQFTDGEQRRIERRIVFFVAKGVPKDEAAVLAQHLVLERDRMNERRLDGSCAECEAWSGGGCRAEKEGSGVTPRPIHEVWNCWCARRPLP